MSKSLSVNPGKREITVTVDADQLNWVNKIRTFDGDIESFKSRIKGLKEQLQEELENTDEYDEVIRLTEELRVAKENLKRRMEGNSQYIHLTEELADERLSMKDAQENLSDFLLGYFAETHEKQIELGPANAREVVLKGKLGKKQSFQTNIFSKPPINTPEAQDAQT